MYTLILSIKVNVRKLGYGLQLENRNSLCLRLLLENYGITREINNKLWYDLYASHIYKDKMINDLELYNNRIKHSIV